MDKIRFKVHLDRPYYQPGQIIEGHFICDPYHQSIELDCVIGILRGEAVFNLSKEQQSSSQNRILIDEQFELWRHCTVSEMLGLDDYCDENQNENLKKGPASSKISVPTSFPIRIQIPHFAPPSFQCPGSPVNIRFSLEIELLNKGELVSKHEEPLSILSNQAQSRKNMGTPVNYNKTFHFSKDRSIFAEFIMKTDLFSTTDKIDACINISNRWKQSIKYVHLNVVRRISVLDFEDQIVESIKIDTTGVGLPSGKHKIAVGESYSLHPSFNIPALPPNIFVSGLFKTDYSLKVSIGRAHNFVLANFEIPITITTLDSPYNDRKRCRDEVLVDISSSNNNIFSSDALN